MAHSQRFSTERKSRNAFFNAFNLVGSSNADNKDYPLEIYK